MSDRTTIDAFFASHADMHPRLHLPQCVLLLALFILSCPANPRPLPELATAADAASGRNHVCAIDTVGSVRCWGWNSNGQLGDGSLIDRSSSSASNVVVRDAAGLALGTRHSCALMRQGEVVCWGANEAGQLGDRTDVQRRRPVAVQGLPGPASALSAGGAFTCALVQGGVYCWGSNASGELGSSDAMQFEVTPVSGLAGPVVEITAGDEHACAVLESGEVACWGANEDGQLGDGTRLVREGPVLVQGLGSSAVALVAGARHACAITQGAEIRCWGDNRDRQVGGTATSQPTAVPVHSSGGGIPVALALGSEHTCAGFADGRVECWGDNRFGQLGTGDVDARAQPSLVLDLDIDVQKLIAGGRHSCAVAVGGRMRCWGNNFFGQLGDGLPTARPTPRAVIGLTSTRALTAGAEHSCAFDTAGTVRCWGSNRHGQLGDGSTITRLTPATAALPLPAISISAGARHTCSVVSDRRVWCWGSNDSGQLGNDGVAQALAPTMVPGLTDATIVAAGDRHSCALLIDGGIRCWGDNDRSQLGDGTTIPRSQPVAVAAIGPASSVAAGFAHTCALVDSRLRCWGHNGSGQLGVAPATSVSTPVVPTFFANFRFTSVGAGGFHTCVTLEHGSPICFGRGSNGQLGYGGTFDLWSGASAERPGDYRTPEQLSAGLWHACKVIESQLFCWGGGESGQIGRVDARDHWLPSAVEIAGEVAEVAAGYWHTCARTRGGAVMCWGYNFDGQVGDGSRWAIPRPRKVVMDLTRFFSGFEANEKPSRPSVASRPLNDTGLQTCYSATGAQSCDAPSVIAGQDALVGRDALAAGGELEKVGQGSAGFDFSKIGNNGDVLPVSAERGENDDDWACTRDNVTGLTWETKRDEADHVRHHAHHYTWFDPDRGTDGIGSVGNTESCADVLAGAPCNVDEYVAAINAFGLCGYNDWRLPGPNELIGILDLSRSDVMLDPEFFPGIAAQAYWTDSPGYQGWPNAVWMSWGQRKGENAAIPLPVLLVRGAK